MISIKQMAEALGKPKQVPDGFLCRCPLHDDKESSLSLKLAPSGKLVANCFAGCDWKDLFDEFQRRGLIDSQKKSEAHRHTGTPATGPITYTYHNEAGEIIFQKLRFPNKKFAHRRFDKQTGQWFNNLQGVPPIIYNLPAVLNSQIVYLCEGEKDADNLINFGLCATTNHCGALTWKDEYNSAFTGRTVVILEDNDDAGRKRTKKLILKLKSIAAEIRVFAPPHVPDHGDISDWIAAGNDPKKIFELSELVSTTKPQSASKKATREQFFDLFERVLKNPRKCIFSEKLMTFDDQCKLWNPAVNLIDVIKSEAAVVNETSETKFQLALIQPHFFAYEQTKKAEFLIDLPEWDGRDRISEMAYLMKLKPSAGMDECVFSELLKDWCATMFRRLYNPMIQNRIMVLQGNQGIGKDTWINMLIDGLGQFAVPLAVVKEDKDTYLNLHRGLVMKISEFDKTAKAEVSTLKDIITTPSTNIRAPYDRDSKVRHSRCSFISSANIENILRDYTGNRRFLIFEIESIEYPHASWTEEQKDEWRLQCLAEAKCLADKGYQASKESFEAMRQYIEKKTPDDPSEDTYREFVQQVKKDIMYSSQDWLEESDIADIAQAIKQRSGMNVRAIREQLRRKIGHYLTEGDRRVWRYKVPNDYN